MDKATRKASACLLCVLLSPSYTTIILPQNICEGVFQMHFRVAVRNFRVFNASMWFLHMVVVTG